MIIHDPGESTGDESGACDTDAPGVCVHESSFACLERGRSIVSAVQEKTLATWWECLERFRISSGCAQAMQRSDTVIRAEM
jgi:hypothetical protein